MATTPAMGTGPLEFTSEAGKHISIPLTAIQFDASGTAVVDAAWSPLTTTPPGSTVLALAVQSKSIQPRPTPSPYAAMIFKAADPGAGGNNIKVTVAVSTAVASPPTNDPTLSDFSLTVTEVDTYTGLTTATIESILGSISGSTTVTGTKPGLVQVVHGSVDTKASPTASGGFLAGSPAEYNAPGDGTPPLAFTLAAKKSGTDGNLTQITITPNAGSPPSSGPALFSLTASWTKTVPGITLDQLESMVQSSLGYEIKVSKPGSGAYSVPANGDSVLSGGGPGTAATATVFTAQ